MQAESKTVKILDARKHEPGPFSDTGFTLIQLDKEPQTKNWRPGSQDIHLFREQMEPYLMKLYPQTKGVKTIVFFTIMEVVRGLSGCPTW